MELLLESGKFFICNPIYDVECQWKILKHVFADRVIIHLHVVEQCFLVTQVDVIFKMVAHKVLKCLVLLLALVISLG